MTFRDNSDHPLTREDVVNFMNEMLVGMRALTPPLIINRQLAEMVSVWCGERHIPFKRRVDYVIWDSK